MKWLPRHLSGFIPVLGLEDEGQKRFVYALKQTMLVILNFHLNEDSFFFVGVGVIEVDPLVYSLNAHMILNQFSKAGKQGPRCCGKSLLILLSIMSPKCFYPNETQ